MKLPPKVDDHNNCGTPECCGGCETADLGKDWYLISINPWFKMYFNSKTGESKTIQLEKT